jgi:hypothetical protein
LPDKRNDDVTFRRVALVSSAVHSPRRWAEPAGAIVAWLAAGSAVAAVKSWSILS